MKTVGTVSRGVRLPIVKQGEDLVKVVTDSIVEMGKEQGLTFHEKDVVAVTESVVARVQGNYVSIDDIAADAKAAAKAFLAEKGGKA